MEHRKIPAAGHDVEIELYSLAPHGTGVPVSALAYLQHARSGVAKALSPTGKPEDSPQAKLYFAGLDKFCDSLADQIVHGLGDAQPDAILELPSSRDFNAPYTAALRNRFPLVQDLTGALSRLGQVRSGETGSFDDVLEDTIASPNYDISKVRTIVIVDDVLGNGKTVGAAIVRLRERGLPADARILVATPLVIVGTKHLLANER